MFYRQSVERKPLQDKRSQLKNELFYPLDWEKTLLNLIIAVRC
jgi:hypothetical protein